ncbi:MAG: hypothetical protein J6T38_01915 [Bacteroidaceae bacterium]|nr:hypothetical protein [Bacteroidaceae bacterium]
MDKFELQKLRDLPIEGVAERLGLEVKMHMALCPFHDDHHASLSFKVSRNTFRCFVCGESGGTIDLVKGVLHKDFLDACRWLADENNVIVQEFKVQSSRIQEKPFDASRYERFFERPWLSIEARKFLFEERKLDERVVRWCRLTSWQDKKGVNWLQIPYYNQEGKLVGIQNRNLGFKKFKVQEVQGSISNCQLSTVNCQLVPRFRFPQGSQCSIYNLPILKLLQPGEDLYITEGCSDCWAMLSAGHKAIAIPSATLLKPKDVELLSIVNCQLSTRFHMFPDRDEPGERLFLQLKELLPNLEHHQLPLGCKDYSEYYLRLEI